MLVQHRIENSTTKPLEKPSLKRSVWWRWGRVGLHGRGFWPFFAPLPCACSQHRQVGNFTRWKDHDEYQKRFNWLLRDLKADAEKVPWAWCIRRLPVRDGRVRM